MSDPLTLSESARVAAHVLIDAIADLERRIPKRRVQYPTLMAEMEAASRRETAAKSIAEAVRFFEDPETHFHWLSAGLGFDPEKTRRALRARILTAKSRLERYREEQGSSGCHQTPRNGPWQGENPEEVSGQGGGPFPALIGDSVLDRVDSTPLERRQQWTK